MTNTYWTPDKTESLVSLTKQGCTLHELQEKFPVKSSMSIIFALRAVSALGMVATQNKEAQKKIRDQRLSKREAYSDADMTWEDWDCSRLKSYFLQPMSIEDVYSNLGRSYKSIFKQMEKMYPRLADRQKLFEAVAFFVRLKPLNKVISENPSERAIPLELSVLKKQDISLVKDVCFDNIESRIITELESARWSIKVAVAWITNNAIAKVILSKLESGLVVTVILNKDKINCGNGAIDFQAMCEKGLSLHWVENVRESLMHEKFCIIDNECLIEGTYNWTNKAEQKNDEHIIVVKGNAELINAFIERFDSLCEKYSAVETGKPQEWIDRNKSLKEAYTDYLLKLRQEKEQKAIKKELRSKSLPIPPKDTWTEYYSRPWTIDDEALLLRYYYKEKLSVKVLSNILKRTESELNRRLETLEQEAILLDLVRSK